MFMCGDFIARTGQENGKGPLDSLAGSGEDEYVFERSSQDLGSNAFGAELLNLCSAQLALMKVKHTYLRRVPAQLTILFYQMICAHKNYLNRSQ